MAFIAFLLGTVSLHPVLAQNMLSSYAPGALPPGCSADILAALTAAMANGGSGQSIEDILNGTSSSGAVTGGGTSGIVSNTNPSGISVSGSGNSITYTAADGTQYTQTGGSPAWRNNNPGNIEITGSFANSFAAANGAIGQNGPFAIFPDAATGAAAQATLLASPQYSSKTILQTFQTYAPAGDGNNNPVAYATTVAAATGVSINTPLSQLNASQMQTVLTTSQKVEGYIPGTTTKL